MNKVFFKIKKIMEDKYPFEEKEESFFIISL